MLDYERKAKILIKTAMAKQDLDYQKLKELLESKGISITRENLTNKINRGKCSFAFALCLFDALNMEIN